MTSLRENIKKSLDDNLKKRDNIATATLRLILAAVKDSDIENRSKKKETPSPINKFYCFFKIWLSKEKKV